MNEGLIKALRKELLATSALIEELESELQTKRFIRKSLEDRLRSLEDPSTSEKEVPGANSEGIRDTPVIKVVREIMSEYVDKSVKDSFILEEAVRRGFASTAKRPQQTIYWALRHLQRVGLVKRTGKGFWAAIATLT